MTYCIHLYLSDITYAHTLVTYCMLLHLCTMAYLLYLNEKQITLDS